MQMNLDPDWAPYSGLYGAKEAQHPVHGPCFICEGRYLVEEALTSVRAGRLTLLSILTATTCEDYPASSLPDGSKRLYLSPEQLETLLGFQFHRGILACLVRPEAPTEDLLLSASRLVVLPHLDNVDNLGQILRSAAALGMDAVLIGSGPGPFDRRTVRVSMGAAWKIPVFQSQDLATLVLRWRNASIQSEIVGAALASESVEASEWQPSPRTALVLGPEDRGLDDQWLSWCDRVVCIPMHNGMDSLNVAAAAAILMHRMVRTRASTTRNESEP